MIGEVRKKISETDETLRTLLVKRMELSVEVARCKREMGEDSVYRPEREAEILQAGSASVEPGQREAYTASMRGIMAASRMLQYDRMALWHGEGVDALLQGLPEGAKGVKVRMRTDFRALSVFLFTAGARGVKVTKANLEGGVCDLRLVGDPASAPFRALLYQMAKESEGLSVTGAVFDDPQ